MSEEPARGERHLFVSWRDVVTGSIHPIGLLLRRVSPVGEVYSFVYLKLAEQLERFEPLPGLADLHRRYESQRLFPVFANRVMPRSRPDFDLLAARVDLAGDADPFEVMVRHGGRRATDRIEVFAGPERTPEGDSTVLFFARGIRHVPGAAAVVDTLRPGDSLELVDDFENRVNPRAVLLHGPEQRAIGHVPDYLVEHVHELRQLNRAEPSVLVDHVNDASTVAHLRLLCRLSAPWPAGYEPFSGPEFQPLVGPA